MKLLKRMLIALLVACSLLLVAPVVTPLFESSYTVEAASIKLNKTKHKMIVGTTYNLKVKGTSKKVKWSSSNTKVAKVNSNGKVTAKKKGTTTIKAKIGKTTYKCKITVENPSISKKSLILATNSTYKLKVNNTTQSVKWSSSNQKVAKVNSKGNVTALKYGTTTITAKIGNKKYKCKVTVAKKPKVTAKITKTYTLSDGLSNFHYVEGILTNKTNSNLGSAYIEINFYDENGKYLSYANDFSCWVDKEGKWKFQTYIISDKKVCYYKIKEISTYFDDYYIGEKNNFKTQITKVNAGYVYPYVGTTYTINGKVKNINKEKIYSQYAKLVAYDKDGCVIDASTIYLGEIGKNKTVTFKGELCRDVGHKDAGLVAKKFKLVSSNDNF